MNKSLHKAAAAMGRKGGKAGTGTAKARTTEQARKAALARWAKYARQDVKHKQSLLERLRAFEKGDSHSSH